MATMTIQDAAHKLGISEITVRRKLKSGQLVGQQEEAPNGRWWVEISDEKTLSIANPKAVATANRMLTSLIWCKS